MTDSEKNDWIIRQMEEGEIDAVVDRFFAAYPDIERGPQRMDTFA